MQELSPPPSRSRPIRLTHTVCHFVLSVAMFSRCRPAHQRLEGKLRTGTHWEDSHESCFKLFKSAADARPVKNPSSDLPCIEPKVSRMKPRSSSALVKLVCGTAVYRWTACTAVGRQSSVLGRLHHCHKRGYAVPCALLLPFFLERLLVDLFHCVLCLQHAYSMRTARWVCRLLCLPRVDSPPGY